MPEEPNDLPPPSEDELTQMMTPPTGGGSFLPPAPAPLREVIGDFEIVGKLGEGGMGAVYRARQVSLHRLVALKVLPGHMIEDAESVARFQDEARVAARVSHANLVRVFAAGEAEERARPTVATATKGKPFENTLGMQFVPVPIIGGATAGQRVEGQPRGEREVDRRLHGRLRDDVACGEFSRECVWALRHGRQRLAVVRRLV